MDIQPIILECRRCGVVLSGQHSCKAANRKCFLCKEYGHYSKFCLRRKPARSADLNQQQHAEFTPKSTKKQTRDVQRLLEFRERKTRCVSLPFYEMDNDEFSRFIRKTQFNCDIVCVSQVSVVSSMAQILSFQEENRVLSLKVTELTNAVQNECRRRQAAEDETHIAVYHATKEHETVICQHKQELSDQKLQIKSLQRELQLHSDNVCSLEQEIQKLTVHREKLYKLVIKLGELESSALMKVEAMQHEFESVLDQFYGGCWSDASCRRQPCRKCGSSNNHRPSDCLANGNECANCTKPNHFTALCRATKSLMPQGAEATEIALMEEVKAQIGVDYL